MTKQEKQKLLSSIRAMENVLMNMKQVIAELRQNHIQFDHYLHELSNQTYITEMAFANVGSLIRAETAVEEPIHLDQEVKGSIAYNDR